MGCAGSFRRGHCFQWTVDPPVVFCKATRVPRVSRNAEPGVASVSAAVRDRRGQIVAAVSLSGPIERLTRQPSRRFGRDVAEAAKSVTAAVAA